MKISELMTILQRLQNEEGDIDVMFEDTDWGDNIDVRSVAVQQEDRGHWLNRDEYVEYVKQRGIVNVDINELQSESKANESFFVCDGTNTQTVVVLGK